MSQPLYMAPEIIGACVKASSDYALKFMELKHESISPTHYVQRVNDVLAGLHSIVIEQVQHWESELEHPGVQFEE